VFSKPVLVAGFLFVNGLILLGGERLRRRGADTEAQQAAADLGTRHRAQRAAVAAGTGCRTPGAGGHGAVAGGGRHSSGSGR